MKNLKTKTQIIAVSLLSIMFITSCQKDDDTLVEKSPEQEANVSYKVTTSGNYTTYEVDPAIMSAFHHYHQLTAPSPIDGSKACGPVSYMMAAYPLAYYISGGTTAYSCGDAKLGHIVGVTGVSTYLYELKNYGNNQDGSFIKADTIARSSRAEAKTLMQNALANNKFVIAAINVYGGPDTRVDNVNRYSNSSLNPDMDPTSETSTTYVTTKYGNYQKTADCRGTGLSTTARVAGHIIVIVKITVNNIDGTGVVEYIDPLASTRVPYGTSNRRYMSYTRLLNSMEKNGCSNKYNALFVGLK